MPFKKFLPNNDLKTKQNSSQFKHNLSLYSNHKNSIYCFHKKRKKQTINVKMVLIIAKSLKISSLWVP